MSIMNAVRSPQNQLRVAAWVGIGLVTFFALVYLLTLDNGLQPEELRGGDLITHQYAQVQGRPGNAPGYPLYTMGGWLWYRYLRAFAPSPANPIPLLSSYSTVWALLALWLLYQIVRFVSSTRYREQSRHGRAGDWLLALLIASFYGVTYFFWYYATTTEQYSSAIAQTLAIFYLYLLWSEAAEGSGDEDESGTRHNSWGRAEWLVVTLALLCGVSLAHMLTVAFIVPPLVAVVLWQRPDYLRRGWLILACMGAAALPLLSYTYVYIRGAAHPEWWGRFAYANANEWFWAFVSTDQGRRELGWGAGAAFTWTGNGFPALIWQELSVPLLVIGLVGVAFLQRRSAWLIYGTTVIYIVFCWVYRYGNWFQVILPLYPLILVGVAAAVERLHEWQPFVRSRLLTLTPYLLLLVAIGWRAAESLPAANSRDRAGDTALDRAAVLLNSAPPDSALFAALDDRLGIDYLIDIWGLDNNRHTINSNNANVAGREGALFSTWEATPTLLDEIGQGNWRVVSASPDWVQVLSEGELPRDPVAEGAILYDPISVDRGAVQIDSINSTREATARPVTSTAPALNIVINWRMPSGEWPADLAYSVRPTLAGEYIRFADGTISQRDARQPLGDLYSFALDRSALREDIRLPLATALPDGADGLQIIFYNPESGEVIQQVEIPLEGPPQDAVPALGTP